jgi:cysteinyl-tRNA synthetase
MRIFNTLSGRKEELAPADGKTVRFYVCGITPYAPAHVGHAMSFFLFDALRRYLEFRGYDVIFVQNFTDIDDKIIDRASRTQVSAADLAQEHIDEFFAEMRALNVKPATIYPRATEEIDGMIEIVQGLIDKDYAYPSSGDVYFRVRKVDDYGSLSHRTLEGMRAGSRVEANSLKDDPLDFALWKAAKDGEPSWPSPWGPGRPGWHIECSAMSLRHLGETVDIHGGGQDLIFPHHENEIAQSESYTGHKPFVRIWMHNGLLQLDEEKMSKSLGNLVTIREALDDYSADALRLFVLSSYYRSPLKFSGASVEAAERGMQRLRNAVALESKGSGNPVDAAPYHQRFIDAMEDDFNSPQAVATLFDLAREVNRGAEGGRATADAQGTLRELSETLGFRLDEPGLSVSSDIGPFVELLIQTRADLRKAKQFDLADQLRDRLAELGVSLEDGPEGTRWHMRR